MSKGRAEHKDVQTGRHEQRAVLLIDEREVRVIVTNVMPGSMYLYRKGRGFVVIRPWPRIGDM